MRLPSRTAQLLAVATLPLALIATACSSDSTAEATTASPAPTKAKDPNEGLLTGTQLKKALAPASYFAAGFTVDPETTRDTGDTYRAPATHNAAEPDCTRFGSTGWIDLSGIEGVSFAQNTYVGKNTSSELDQEIDVYRGTTSTDVMTALTKVVAACPGYPDADTKSKVKITGAATPVSATTPTPSPSPTTPGNPVPPWSPSESARPSSASSPRTAPTTGPPPRRSLRSRSFRR